ncbi:MAG: hypothetical protein ACRC9O_09540 [Plesiomonas sp.]|uniref:hypothetical protein n=1 Tax=Plesiomonas sp. TaxID=2486279 RepID=UPI003F3F60D7
MRELRPFINDDAIKLGSLAATEHTSLRKEYDDPHAENLSTSGQADAVELTDCKEYNITFTYTAGAARLAFKTNVENEKETIVQ